MNAHSYFNRVSRSLISRRGVLMLVGLGWSSLAFCGEINDAARKGELEKIKTLLKDNHDAISSKDDRGETPLHGAAFAGRKDVVDFLLANKADVNARNKGGETPLHEAAYEGRADVVEVLLANKAEVNARESRGGTPLHEAACQGHKDIVNLLLANKAAVNARTTGRSMYEAVVGDKDAPALLLDSKSDLKNTGSQTPLLWAAANGHTEVAKLLVASKADVNARSEKGDTPLLMAAANGHADVVKLLLANKADVDSAGPFGETPLHRAAYYGHKDVAELLLASGAAVAPKDYDNHTPLHLAAQRGHTDVVELLRQRGASEMPERLEFVSRFFLRALIPIGGLLVALSIVKILMMTCFRRVRDRRVRIFTAVGAAVLAILAGKSAIFVASYAEGYPRQGMPFWLGFAGIHAIRIAAGGILGGVFGRAMASSHFFGSVADGAAPDAAPPDATAINLWPRWVVWILATFLLPALSLTAADITFGMKGFNFLINISILALLGLLEACVWLAAGIASRRRWGRVGFGIFLSATIVVSFTIGVVGYFAPIVLFYNVR